MKTKHVVEVAVVHRGDGSENQIVYRFPGGEPMKHLVSLLDRAVREDRLGAMDFESPSINVFAAEFEEESDTSNTPYVTFRLSDFRFSRTEDLFDFDTPLGGKWVTARIHMDMIDAHDDGVREVLVGEDYPTAPFHSVSALLDWMRVAGCMDYVSRNDLIEDIRRAAEKFGRWS